MNVSKVSSIIKIVFNVCGLSFSISNIRILLTSTTTSSLSKCMVTTNIEMIMNFAFSELVMIFLIWKLEQLGKSENHDYIGYSLLLIRSLLHVSISDIKIYNNYVLYVVYLLYNSFYRSHTLYSQDHK